MSAVRVRASACRIKRTHRARWKPSSGQLVHMNGRVYDYALGRFLSVDPFIQFPLNSQSLNPYSYLGNNPLSGTDPTGYEKVCDAKGQNCAEVTHEAPTGSNIKSNTVVTRSDGKSTVSVTLNKDGNVVSASASGAILEQGAKLSGVPSAKPTTTPAGSQIEHPDMLGAENEVKSNITVTTYTDEVLTGKKGDDFVSFNKVGGQRLRDLTAQKHDGFEHCYRECEPAAGALWQASIVTIRSHLACGTSSGQCPVGSKDLGYANHLHADTFKMNEMDEYLNSNFPVGRKITADRNNPSDRDYQSNGGRGLLTTPAGVFYYHGNERVPLVPLDNMTEEQKGTSR